MDDYYIISVEFKQSIDDRYSALEVFKQIIDAESFDLLSVIEATNRIKQRKEPKP